LKGVQLDSYGNVISYSCAANFPTIGYGSTKYKGQPVEDDMTALLKQDADELLLHEMDEYEGYVNHIALRSILNKTNLTL
jgi:GH24 family phage-related lysozyme (muramidase)